MHLKTDTSSNAHFARVPTISKPRNRFGMSEVHKTTTGFDYLYPIHRKLIYPGDSISGQLEILARLQAQLSVLYDDLYMDLHAWFCPLRLLQTDFARFQFNSQPLGPAQDNSALTTPKIDLSLLPIPDGGTQPAFASKSLYDYLGYKPLVQFTDPNNYHFHNYFARAYNLTWNLNYRDQNLQNAVTVDLDNGPDNPNDYVLLKRGRRHDIFSSALPFQQKGTAPSLSLGTAAPVVGIGKSNQVFPQTNVNVFESGAQSATYAFGSFIDPNTANNSFVVEGNAATGGYPLIFADLLNVIGAPTVNALRQTIAVQHYLEADARGGTRDVESILHRWGVQVPDYRMDRPEYLGGMTFTFDGIVVPQTSETGTTPQANLAQFSQSKTYFGINHSFVEHGCFFILFSARSNVTYQDGFYRDDIYKTKLDFYQPEFANLGEVAIPRGCTYMSGLSTQDLGQTWGFNEYGWELRYGMNRVSAEFRSNFPQSLDYMHMADDYNSPPTLGPTWIQSNTPIERNIALEVSDFDPIMLNTKFNGTMARTLPMYSVPGLDKL